VLSCREVTRSIAADELETSTLGRRLQVRLHLLMCRHCRRYAAQMRAIGQAAREIFRPAPDEKATVDRLRDAILKSEADPDRS
jgi:anti-sigma factor RsiW